jgi:hypothetical protein
MTDRSFSLYPFHAHEEFPEVEIFGTVSRRTNLLTLRYTMLGDLSVIAMPSPVPIPARRNKLWKETCFEFFISIKNSLRYWEFNMSPAGHWNVYRFTDHRQGRVEEIALKSLPFRFEKEPDAYSLTLDLNLDRIMPSGHVLEMGISSVLKPHEGTPTFWALTHPGTEADFHRRDSFILEL